MLVSELRDAKPSKLTDAGDAWDKLAEGFGKHITDCGQYFQKWLGGRGEYWNGRAAESASDKLSRMVKYLGVAKQELDSLGTVLRAAGERFTLAQDQLKKVLAEAEGAHYKVSDDGSVTAPTFSTAGMTGGEIGVRQRDQQSAAQGYADRIGSALSAAEKADKEFAKTVKVFTDAARRCAKGDWSVPYTDTLAAYAAKSELLKELGMPGEKGKPADVKAWWDGLSPSLQAELLEDYPQELGNRDGIPAADRDKANRTYLPTLLNQLEAEYEGASGDRAESLKNKIEGVKGIQEQLAKGGEPRPYLLGLGTEGNGRAIVSIGNPDAADNVVTFVPGTGSTLGSADGNIERSLLMQQQAERTDPTHKTASIMWLGYDAPQGLGEAQDTKYADNARGALSNFLTGIDTTHGGSVNSTILGHSYGTLVAGETMRDHQDLPVDNAIMIASPGTGVDHAKDLNIPADRVWSATAKNDLINLAPPSAGTLGPLNPKAYMRLFDDHSILFGNDPISDEFGGQTFAVPDGKLPFTDGLMPAHSQYWESEPLADMTNIVTGGRP
jgi:hypothetical protein